jgi:Ca2+-binding RTX toxin-like protein
VPSGGTIVVSPTAIAATTTTSGSVDCPAGSEGTLSILADRNIIIASGGEIDADGAHAAFTLPLGDSTPSGTGGGGSAFDGTAGEVGAGGGSYNNHGPNLLVLPGSPGARLGGGPGSPGGGAIRLRALRTLTVGGVLSADGADGPSTTCGDPNSSGGGAGGGITLSATTIDVTGASISAAGGDGGDGTAGGAGSGGLVKAIGANIPVNPVADVSGGAGGTSACTTLTTAAAPAGVLYVYRRPICAGLPATIAAISSLAENGTDGDDVIVGDDDGNNIAAFGGNDVICTGNGTFNRVHGGDGDDRIQGGSGNDQLSGVGGNDRIFGGAGNDELNGNDGNDRLFGEAGDDTNNGFAGNDVISDAQGNDTLLGHEGADQLSGATGTDTCDGGVDADTDTAAATCETRTNIP